MKSANRLDTFKADLAHRKALDLLDGVGQADRQDDRIHTLESAEQDLGAERETKRGP